MWRVRLAGLVAAGGFLATALGIRMFTGSGDILDSSGALAQYSGTALYGSIIYAGVFILAPRTRPVPAAAYAIAFCWLVEFLQLTGFPAELSRAQPAGTVGAGRTVRHCRPGLVRPGGGAVGGAAHSLSPTKTTSGRRV
jgi:hypothetical protein